MGSTDCWILGKKNGPSLSSGLTVLWIHLWCGHVWVICWFCHTGKHLKFLTWVQCHDCLSSRAAHAGHAHLAPPLQDSARDCTILAILPDTFFPSLFAFAHSVMELHCPGTKQTLSIQRQPLVSALTARNCLWDQALIERVFRHDFLVIAFKDLILSPFRRQRQLRALRLKDGAWCLTNLDLTGTKLSESYV